MDAISLLKDDHRAVEQLFKRFERTSDGALVERRRIVDEIIKELSVHAEIEETVFYPTVRAQVPPTEDEVLEALEEHHVVKWLLSELDGMAPDHERFEPKVMVLMESVRHHVREEESELFPQVRKAMSRRALDDMGEAMARAKTVAPTRPHPRSPDTPPGNIVTGVVASAIDRAREAGQELVEGAAGVVSRAAASAGGGSAPAKRTRKAAAKRKATARKAARSTAKRGRATAKKATGTAKRTAKRTTKKTTGAAKKATGTAKRTAKRTTKKAAGSAKKATGTAKRTATRTTKKASGSAKKATRTTKATARKATGATRRTAKKATGAAKATARTAAGTTKRTAKRPAKRPAKKATGATKGRARKTTSRPRRAAKKRG